PAKKGMAVHLAKEVFVLFLPGYRGRMNLRAKIAHPLPPVFADWFAARGWSPRPHQLALIDHAQAGESVLLVAPTGGGKTLAGFLPSRIELAGVHPRSRARAVHTIYRSPL